MVMADIGDRDRGRRRRRRGGRKEFYEPDMMPAVVMPTKPPIILAKPSATTNDKMTVEEDPVTCNGPEITGISIDKPPILLKARTENHRQSPVNGTLGNVLGMMGGDRPISPPLYSIQRASPATHKVAAQDSVRQQPTMEAPGPARLALPPEMSRSVKLVDDSFNWSDNGMEMLVDQTDFLVVGVLGLQGVGKSFLLSHLATNSGDFTKLGAPLRPQQKDARETCSHQTVGIDMYVTSERTIYLDTQAMLSASVLHDMIQNDKKYPTEFTSGENCMEIQSLQIAAFMLTVCNVVIVVADWFIDTNLVRLMRTAEMLKPATPGHDGTAVDEYFPHLVFVVNYADRDDFSLNSFTNMQNNLDMMMSQSKLKYKGGVNPAGCVGLPGLMKRSLHNTTNLCLLPPSDDSPAQNGGVKNLLPDYRGHPGFDSLMNNLRKQLLSIPRHLLTHTSLSEKNWFHYAARTWDGVKKSQMFLEYNRLLP